jgi:hypothetical protein
MIRLAAGAVTAALVLAAGAVEAQTPPPTAEALTECASLLYAKSLLDTSDVLSEASVMGAMRLVEKADRLDASRTETQIADHVVNEGSRIFLEYRELGDREARLDAFWARNPSLPACISASAP